MVGWFICGIFLIKVFELMLSSIDKGGLRGGMSLLLILFFLVVF